MKRAKFVPFIAAGLAVFLAACGSGTPSDGSGSSSAPAGGGQDASTPRQGGMLRLMALGAVNIADPHKTQSVANTAEVWGAVANSLLRLDWQKQIPTPNLAEKWEWNDPKTLTLKLKQGVHFQKESMGKGREVEAADAVASLERVRTNQPDFTGKLAWVNVDKFEAADKYTVKVTFKQPDANFVYWASHPMIGAILPKEAVDKFGNNLAELSAWYGSGPFVFDRDAYKPDVSAVVKRNPDYDLEKGLPYLDGIEFYTIADASTRLAALRAAQVDIGLVPNREADSFKQKGFTMGSTKDISIAGQHLAMNTQIAPTSDWRVRKAIHLALDREELIQIVTDGFGCIPIILGCRPDWFLSETEWADKPGFRKDKSKDIAEAKALLAEAGVPPGTTIKLHSSAQNPYKVHFEQAVAVKGILERNLGLKIEHKAGLTAYDQPKVMLEQGAHLANTSHGGVGGIILDIAAWNHFHSRSPNNGSVWNDPKTDELIEKQATLTDPEQRKKVLHELQRYLMEDKNLPGAPTARNYDWWAAAPHIKAWTPSSYFLSNYTWQFDKVWINK